MPANLSTIIRPVAPSSPGAFSRLLDACCGRIADYFDRRAAIAALRQLDDRELRDIGLVRCEIEARVGGYRGWRDARAR